METVRLVFQCLLSCISCAFFLGPLDCRSSNLLPYPSIGSSDLYCFYCDQPRQCICWLKLGLIWAPLRGGTFIPQHMVRGPASFYVSLECHGSASSLVSCHQSPLRPIQGCHGLIYDSKMLLCFVRVVIGRRGHCSLWVVGSLLSYRRHFDVSGRVVTNIWGKLSLLVAFKSFCDGFLLISADASAFLWLLQFWCPQT